MKSLGNATEEAEEQEEEEEEEEDTILLPMEFWYEEEEDEEEECIGGIPRSSMPNPKPIPRLKLGVLLVFTF
jgi:hypothetical protein